MSKEADELLQDIAMLRWGELIGLGQDFIDHWDATCRQVAADYAVSGVLIAVIQG